MYAPKLNFRIIVLRLRDTADTGKNNYYRLHIYLCHFAEGIICYTRKHQAN